MDLKFYQALESAINDHSIVIITDVEGTITFVNKKAQEITGYTKAELIGANHRVINSGVHPIEFWKEMYRTVGRKETWYDKVCNRAKDGHLYWVDTTIAPMMGENGKIEGYISIRTNITGLIHAHKENERHAVELVIARELALQSEEKAKRSAELLAAQNMLEEERKQHDRQMLQQSRLAQMGEMISMIAHQWRQPLAAAATAIFNMKLKIELESFDLESQEEREASNEFFIETLGNVEEYIQNLSITIDDFRNFHKSDKKIVTTSLKEVTHNALKIVRNSLMTDNIELIEEYGDNTKLQMIDNEIIQVVLNIVKNAQDNFIENKIQNPQIKITTHNNTLNICDNGGGIPASIVEKIFDPYFSTKNEKNGTGLGLYMSKTIIEDHHKGTLSTYNQDGGVCFSITLSDEMISA